MLTDDELLNLPDDPEMAFIQYENLLRMRVRAAIDSSEGYNIDGLHIEYISNVLGVVKALGLEIFQDREVPPTSYAKSAIEIHYTQLLADVSHYIVQVRLKNSRRIRKYSVAFDPAAKVKLRHHLEKIKEIVDRLEIPSKKKESFYSAIGALDDEINRDRTRFDAMMALILVGAETAGESGRKLEPIRKILDSVTGVFKAAKDDEDISFPSLAAPKPIKQLQPPRKNLPPPDTDEGSGDLETTTFLFRSVGIVRIL